MSGRRLADALWGSLAALLFCIPASAQSHTYRLTVRVADPSGAPVRDARVSASPRDARLLIERETDGNGTARFDALLAGTYILEATAPGFVRIARAVVIRSVATDVALSLELATVTEHVVVTAASQLQTASEVSKAVTVVDADDISARNEFSVADALRTVPGATIQQLSGPGSFTSVKLRGLREQDTSVLIDGVRFRDAA